MSASLPPQHDKFDHLVVLMMENRSFDHLFGYLYEHEKPRRFIPSRLRAFRGVAGRSDLYNLDDQQPPRRVHVSRAPYQTLEDMTHPFPDPGEELVHVLSQMFGLGDGGKGHGDVWDPAPMSGYVRDYLRVARTRPKGDGPPPSDAALAALIMRCFPPEATPVLSGLGRAFAVSDAWFASVPSQTYCNRSFLHAACSSGFVHNANYMKWSQNNATTIFERLAERLPPGRDFRIYWDPEDIVPLTRLIHRPLYEDRFTPYFVDMAAFEDHCAAGDLPAYTFIQPRIIINNNDMHPPYFPFQRGDSSVLAGEDLIARVYNGLRAGPRWERTFLVIIFDESGGTYDHIPPPRATPPHRTERHPLEDGFAFDRFGPRVPAVFVSPYIEPGTVVRAGGRVPFDHTSVIKTLCSRFGLASLTGRDHAAPDFSTVLTRPLDQPRRDTPTLTPRPHRPAPRDEERRAPLSGLKKALLSLALHKRGVRAMHFESLGDVLDLLT